jgi:hypothetical protein
MSESTTQPVNVQLGRAGDVFYFAVRIGGAHGTRVQVDLTAEQYAALVSQQSITVTAEVRTG